MILYDDETELTGNVTARVWLNTFKGFNYNSQTEQAFKIRSAGIKKLNQRRHSSLKKNEKINICILVIF